MDDLDFALECQDLFWKETKNMNCFMDGDRNSSIGITSSRRGIEWSLNSIHCKQTPPSKIV